MVGKNGQVEHKQQTPKFGSHTVQLKIRPDGEISSDTKEGCEPICANFNILLKTNSDLKSSVWTYTGGSVDGETLQKLCFSSAGTKNVSVLLTDVFGCTSTLSSNGILQVHPNPTARFDAVDRSADLLDPSIQFIQQSIDADFYFWRFGDGAISAEVQPRHVYPDTGKYTVCLRVSTTYGCSDSICAPYEILPVPVFFAPSAFTPNGDGTNDRFKIVTTYAKQFQLEIFDRWGELIYSGNNVEEGWDGTFNGNPVQLDVYAWRVTLTNTLLENKRYDGRVMLVSNDTGE